MNKHQARRPPKYKTPKRCYRYNGEYKPWEEYEVYPGCPISVPEYRALPEEDRVTYDRLMNHKNPLESNS